MPLVYRRSGRDPDGTPARSPSGDLELARRPDGSYCVLDGYLLGSEGVESPARRLLEHYEVAGASLVESLRGAFAFVLWDAGSGSLILARDALGIHPLFYSWHEGVLLASPSMELLKAQPEVDTGVNRQLIAEMLLSRFNENQSHETYFGRIRRLPAAHRLLLTPAGLRLERYWDPLPSDFEWASDEELERFPQMLETSVADSLAAGADSLAMSGGFDSVSLAILASELRGDRPPIHAVSLRMTGTDIDEGITQRAVAKALDMPQTMRTLEECLDGEPLLSDALGRSGTSPSPVLSMWQSSYTTLLEIGREVGLSRLMLGSGGDEVLGVDEAYGADCLASGRLGAAWRYFRAAMRTSPLPTSHVARVIFWSGGLRPLLLRGTYDATKRIPSVHRVLEARRFDRWRQRDPWASPHHLERLPSRETLYPTGRGESLGRYRAKMRRLVQHPLLAIEMDQSSTWAHRLGYRCFFPFWDRDLVEMLLRVHPEKLIEGGRFKAPLRRLVAERLPSVELPKRKVDFTKGVADLLRRLGPAAWDPVRHDLELTRLGVVDGERMRAFMQGFFEGRSHDSTTAWEVISTEHWLRSQRDASGRSSPELVLVFDRQEAT